MRRKSGTKRKAKRPAPTSIRLGELARKWLDEHTARTGQSEAAAISDFIEIANNVLHSPKPMIQEWRGYVRQMERKHTVRAKAEQAIRDAEKATRAAGAKLKPNRPAPPDMTAMDAAEREEENQRRLTTDDTAT